MTRYTIIKDGYPFIFTGLAATILVGFLADPAFAGIPLILTIYFAYFFREPDRPLPDDPHVLYSPADGTVMAVEEFFDDEFLHEEAKKVTIFFTFWGLNAIKRLDKPAVKKDIWGKMFGMMLPSSSLKLRLSKMNMGGMGARMMRYIMNKKNIDSLESLRTQAIQNGVEFIACQMSMDVMGVKREELLDHVTIGGVATYMNRAEQANVNLFI